MIRKLSSTQSLLASSLSAATKDIRWLAALFPRHESFVELTGGDHPLLFAKDRSKVEVLNDRDGLVVKLCRILRDPASAKQLAEVVRGTVAGQHIPDDFLQAAKFFHGGRASLRASRTQSWKFGEQFHLCFDGTTEIFEPLARRLCGTQIEKLAWQDALHRYDQPRAFFSINLDSWSGCATDRLPFSESVAYRNDLFGHLASIQGSACVYSRVLGEMDLPNGWNLHRRQMDAINESTPLLAWTNYQVSARGGAR